MSNKHLFERNHNQAMSLPEMEKRKKIARTQIWSKKQHKKRVIRDKAQFATKQRKFNGNKLVACFLKDSFIWHDTICTLLT